MALLPEDQIPTAAVVVSGVMCHVVFNRLEPRNLSPMVFLLLAPPTALAVHFQSSYSNIIWALLFSYAVYIGTLVSSVVAYRLSPLHPLAAFPGPIICKITRLWAWYIVRTGNQHRYYRSLHVRYGTHVRTGPNHLHICDAEAIPTVLGAKGFPRGGRYEVTRLQGTSGSLLSITDPHEHARRRRIWDHGLNTSAVQGYQDILEGRVAQLLGALEKQGCETDLSSWLSCFSFDFMGDLAFGGAFKLMEQGSDVDGYMRLGQLGLKYQEVVGTIPWIKPFQRLLPSVKDIRGLQQFSKESVLARKAQGTTRKDIFYYLLDEEGIGSGPPSIPTLILESTLAIVAGSDTTGTALSNLFFYLLSDPKAYARLQAEVDGAFPPGSSVAVPVLGQMKFLNAVINETLRLQPAVPSGVQRVVPPGTGGAMIAKRWVPRSTTVQIPTYSVHRDPRYFFPHPDSFYPERWIEPPKADSKLDQSAYFPFSYGPMNCVGKNLALQELRMVVCSLLQKFEIQFAPSWDSREWDKNLTDCFILAKGRLPVQVKARK